MNFKPLQFALLLSPSPKLHGSLEIQQLQTTVALKTSRTAAVRGDRIDLELHTSFTLKELPLAGLSDARFLENP